MKEFAAAWRETVGFLATVPHGADLPDGLMDRFHSEGRSPRNGCAWLASGTVTPPGSIPRN